MRTEVRVGAGVEEFVVYKMFAELLADQLIQ